MPIDYSKWDNLQDSSDDDDASPDNNGMDQKERGDNSERRGSHNLVSGAMGYQVSKDVYWQKLKARLATDLEMRRKLSETHTAGWSRYGPGVVALKLFSDKNKLATDLIDLVDIADFGKKAGFFSVSWCKRNLLSDACWQSAERYLAGLDGSPRIAGLPSLRLKFSHKNQFFIGLMARDGQGNKLWIEGTSYTLAHKLDPNVPKVYKSRRTKTGTSFRKTLFYQHLHIKTKRV